VGASVSAGIPGVASAGANYSHNWNTGEAQTQSNSQTATQTTGQSAAQASGDSHTENRGDATTASASDTTSQGAADGVSAGVSGSTAHGVSSGGMSSTTTSEAWGSADTVGHADTRGGADTAGHATTRGTADGVSGSRGTSDTVARSHTVTSGVADSESWSESASEGWTEGQAVGRGYSAGRTHGVGYSEGETVSLGAGRGLSRGIGGGFALGASIGRSWQTEDDVAIRLTDVARGLEGLLDTASVEGGFLTTALLLTSAHGERAAQALVPQAFHGPNVPTPVLTIPAAPYLRNHALALRPSLEPDRDPFGVGCLWSKWGTLLTPAMLAAYTSLNLSFKDNVVFIGMSIQSSAENTALEVVVGGTWPGLSPAADVRSPWFQRVPQVAHPSQRDREGTHFQPSPVSYPEYIAHSDLPD
jgi:hypothetical protein